MGANGSNGGGGGRSSGPRGNINVAGRGVGSNHVATIGSNHQVGGKTGAYANVSHSTTASTGSKPSHAASATVGVNGKSGKVSTNVSHRVTGSTGSKPVHTTSASIAHTTKNSNSTVTKSVGVSTSSNGNHGVAAAVTIRM